MPSAFFTAHDTRIYLRVASGILLEAGVNMPIANANAFIASFNMCVASLNMCVASVNMHVANEKKQAAGADLWKA